MKKQIRLNADDYMVTMLTCGLFDDEIEDGSMTPSELIIEASRRHSDRGFEQQIPWWFGIACEARKHGLSVDVDTDHRLDDSWKNYAIKLDGSQYPLAILTGIRDDGPEALDVVMHEIERLIAHPEEIVPVNDDGADEDDWIGIDGEGPLASMMYEMRRSHERVVDRIRLLNPEK